MTPPLDLPQIRRETFCATVEYHPVLTSTNDRARELAADGCPLPLLVVAAQQTAGRGRGGNRWWTGPGGLAFSLLLPPQPERPSPLISLAAAVAVVQTLAPLAPQAAMGIHWPNDVYVAGRKLSGILVEVLGDGRPIVGIGVNVNNSSADAPEELRPRVATLRDLTARTHDLTAILIDLVQHLAGSFQQLSTDARRITARADELCLRRGELLRAEAAGGPVSGRCLGIAADGALRLETAEGERAIYSGVVRSTCSG
ncbi:MAG: biotin--[acetyl-CoA-carboxylase] ligase [Thermoguttaceae bacterium]|jgi:BirA family biotin operon repressor/biotin-[acetyl-CoA-carboxylase] ligase